MCCILSVCEDPLCGAGSCRINRILGAMKSIRVGERSGRTGETGLAHTGHSPQAYTHFLATVDLPLATPRHPGLGHHQ